MLYLNLTKKRIIKKFFKFLFCSAMIFCLASCGAVGITTNSINVKDVDISDIENDYKYQEIIYPQFEFSGNKEIKKRIDEINDIYKKDAEEFKKNGMTEVRKMQNELGVEKPQYSYITNTDIKRNDDKYLSFMTETYEFTMGAHGSSIIKTYNFDAKTGKILTIYDVMKDKNKLQETIINTLSSEYKDYLYDDYMDDVNKYMNGEKEFAFVIDYDGIDILFEEYEFVARAYGPVKVRLENEK